MSAQRVYEYGTTLLTGPLVNVTGISGGGFLGSGAAFSVTVLNISGNNPMWVGANASGQTPVSGTGFILYAGASLSLRVDNIGDVKIMAETSGQLVSYIGVGR